jgi:hypothetical protein
MGAVKGFQASERRQFGRRRAQLRGIIHVAGRPPLPCVIQNISDSGALLVCDNATWLPFRFRLTIESERLEADCEVRHQTGNATGVFFTRKRIG